MKLFKKNSNTAVQQGNDNSSAAKARIYNLIIVDESGSMSHLRNVTLSGINETINTIREAQKKFADTQIHTLTLVTFDSDSNRPPVRAIILNEPISRVQKFSDYQPSGCTPLYDAMGQSLTTLYNAIKDDPDATAVVTVLTDGMENSSTEWSAQALRALIEKLKEEGWSFSYMGSAHDVKLVTDLLSIENVVEFSHDDLGAGNTWERECSSRNAYYEKMNCMYGEGNISYEERKMRKRQFAQEYYSDRVDPDRIDRLEENEIFVFGSNILGKHTGGASAYAVRRFGAVMGQAEGLQGQSYAIPTVGDPHQMTAAVLRFVQFAANHREMRFLVTPIGCGNAGFCPDQIAPMFADCIKLENVALPASFWQALGLTMQ
ncbi:MAG: hypothetical protein ACI4AK_00870 [Lepagella sp.]